MELTAITKREIQIQLIDEMLEKIRGKETWNLINMGITSFLYDERIRLTDEINIFIQERDVPSKLIKQIFNEDFCPQDHYFYEEV